MKQQQKTYPAIWQFCAAAIIGAAPLVASAAVPQFTDKAAPQVWSKQTDRMIVKYKDSGTSMMGVASAPADGRQRLSIVQRAGQQFGLNTRVLHTTATGAHIVQLDRKMSLEQVKALASELKARDPSVEYAEPDRIMHKLAIPTDPRYKDQWHYFEAAGGLRLPSAWDLSTGGGVVVAVIDTGYRPHADLAGQFLPGYDFISDSFMANDGGGRDSDAQDPGDAMAAGVCGDGEPERSQASSWHGTHVAGTIAAKTNNGIGVAGVAYNARILPVRVLGKCGGYTSDIADGIIWASGGTVAGVPANPNKAKVINMSLGGDGACDATTQAAINGARSRGVVIVVAAGNDNVDAKNSNPANCSGVITVASVDRSGGHAWYSNFGSVVDVAAPGGDTEINSNGVLSTRNAGTGAPGADSYAYEQGTSMAAPHVAGVAALMFARNPGLTPDDLEARLKQSARAFAAPCAQCGSGIVDANAAVIAAGVVVEGFFETEGNNTIATANPVGSSGTSVIANIGSASDTDYFRVQLPAGKTLSSVMVPGTSSADYDLYVYNAAGTQIGVSERGAGLSDTVTVTNTGAVADTRYVRVKYYGGGSGSTNGKYTLKLSW
ncbi:MAG TPA: S8 family peptidase [Telluria sp.]|jgi:serine protease